MSKLSCLFKHISNVLRGGGGSLLIATLLANANLVYGDDDGRTGAAETHSFSATSAVQSIADSEWKVGVSFAKDRFSTLRTVDLAFVTNLIASLDGCTRHRVPTRAELEKRGIINWDPPNPWIVYVFTHASDARKVRLTIYGGASMFEWRRLVYEVNNKRAHKVMKLIEDYESSITRQTGTLP